MQSHEIIRDYVWDYFKNLNYSCMRSWMIGVSVSHMSTKVAKTMFSFLLILEMHCVWTPFGDGGPSALWKSQHLQKTCGHFGGKGAQIYASFDALENQRSLVVTCVNIDLPISTGFYTPQLVPMFSHQQYQSYPTGARWSKIWQRTLLSRSTRSPKVPLLRMFFITGFAWQNLIPGTLTLLLHTAVILATHLQKISTTNRDGGWFL